MNLVHVSLSINTHLHYTIYFTIHSENISNFTSLSPVKTYRILPILFNIIEKLYFETFYKF